MMDKITFAQAWIMSIIAVPVMILHEATHAVACVAFRAELYELFFLPAEGNEGIQSWGVWHETVGGYREIIIALAPLVWLPIGYLVGEWNVWVGIYFIMAGFAGLGDVLHVLHFTGVADVPGIDFEGMEDRHDERVTVWQFSGRST